MEQQLELLFVQVTALDGTSINNYINKYFPLESYQGGRAITFLHCWESDQQGIKDQPVSVSFPDQQLAIRSLRECSNSYFSNKPVSGLSEMRTEKENKDLNPQLPRTENSH